VTNHSFDINKENIVVRGQHANLVGDVDLEKLYTVLRKSWLWIILIVFCTNLTAYLVVRWTKPLFESYSDLKLNIKNDANFLGILEVNDEQNINNLSGEIELIKSKLFFDKVIKTLDLSISYYAVGKILEDEKYRSPPFKVAYASLDSWVYDKQFTVSIKNEDEFTLGYPDQTQIPDQLCRFGETLKNEHFTFRLTLNPPLEEVDKEQLYSFKINSQSSLLQYLENNITVEPLNLTANTIRISFRDHNRYKAMDLV